MDDLLTSFAKDTPALGAMLIIVVVFLRFMSARSAEAISVMKAHDEVMKKITDRYDETARDALIVAKDTATALGRVAGSLDRLERKG